MGYKWLEKEGRNLFGPLNQDSYIIYRLISCPCTVAATEEKRLLSLVYTHWLLTYDLILFTEVRWTSCRHPEWQAAYCRAHFGCLFWFDWSQGAAFCSSVIVTIEHVVQGCLFELQLWWSEDQHVWKAIFFWLLFQTSFFFNLNPPPPPPPIHIFYLFDNFTHLHYTLYASSCCAVIPRMAIKD